MINYCKILDFLKLEEMLDYLERRRYTYKVINGC